MAYQPYPTPNRPQRRRGNAEIYLAGAIYGVALALGALVAGFAPLTVMVTDNCAYQVCRESLVPIALGVVWVGVVGTLVITGVMLVIGTVRHWRALWLWSCLAALGVIGSSGVGLLLMMRADAS